LLKKVNVLPFPSLPHNPKRFLNNYIMENN